MCQNYVLQINFSRYVELNHWQTRILFTFHYLGRSFPFKTKTSINIQYQNLSQVVHHEPGDCVTLDLPPVPVEPPVGVELVPVSETAFQIEDPKEASFTCKDCGKKYGRAKQLYEHRRIVSIKLMAGTLPKALMKDKNC